VADEKRTPLYDQHVAAGGKMVPFAGYLMPIEYAGIIAEHRAVRSGMGMFDLSHMGEFVVSGQRAIAGVDCLMTNDVAGLEVGQARYTPMCLGNGGIVDDLLVYRYPEHLMLVVNASNIDKDLAWILRHVPDGVEVANRSDDIALIAVQGPDATALVQSVSTQDLARIEYYHFSEGEVAGIAATVSRTGYTGEDGVELYVDRTQATSLWKSLWQAGEPRGLTLVGLGARDTLRLEASLALYGNDIDETTTPLEAGLSWTVKLAGRNFVGSEPLTQQKESGVTRRLVAFEMLDRSIPRPHCHVVVDGVNAGEVTSGTFSPTYSKGLGLAYVPTSHAGVGASVGIDIRGQTHPAQIVKKPIYRRSSA